ncbi:MAG TPA: VOC family protein [Thermoplasmata archaeon]|nr:VOC family protein [Thermoplasmata archaeon]
MAKRTSPRVFRVLLAARNLERSRRFYERILGVRGRKVAEGRYYFDCGSVILGILDYSGRPKADWTTPAESTYFAVPDVEAIYRRARTLHCLSTELLHGDPESPLGEIRVRPWGERSFYVEDPSGNSLCFVADTSVFTGTPRQVASLRRARYS